MQLSTVKYLSGAIALPLFLTISNLTTIAHAKQPEASGRITNHRTNPQAIAKAKFKSNSLPSAVDLNLSIPTPVVEPEINPTVTPRRSSSRGLPPAPVIEPFWSPNSGFDANDEDSNSLAERLRQRVTPTVTKKQLNKIKPAAKPKKLTSTKSLKEPLSLSLSSERQERSKLSSKPNIIATANIKIDRQRKLEPVAAVNPVNKDNRPVKPAIKIATGPRTLLGGNYLRLVRKPQKGTNDLGNPIYTLEAYINGQKYREFDVVSGTATTQNLDRDRGNSAAPLPDGTYGVSDRIIPGMMAEVGKTFISIFPRFETERQDLGIHLDPSFNKRNGYDGTAGCIGMTTAADRDAINEFVTKYQPRNLFVKISAERQLISKK